MSLARLGRLVERLRAARGFAPGWTAGGFLAARPAAAARTASAFDGSASDGSGLDGSGLDDPGRDGRGRAAAPGAPQPPPLWPAARLALAGELWGEGFVQPGAAAEILRLAAPLGLSEASSLLLVGVGAGGPARVLAEEFGAWVAAHDGEPALRAAAAAHVARGAAAVAKRVSVAGWNPRDPGLRRHGFHHALVLDGLRHGDIAAALGALVAAVKPGGQFVLQELVAEEPGAALAAWCRLDGRAPPPRAGQIGDELARLGLDIRVSEDQSARHQGQICQGFAARLRELQGARLPAAYAAALVGEAERWLRRVRLMQAGGLRLMRWHALAPGR